MITLQWHKTVHMEPCNWLEEPLKEKAGWKSALVVCGEQSVADVSVKMMEE